jgi:thiol-disulfide isomerase/thioredoxin
LDGSLLEYIGFLSTLSLTTMKFRFIAAAVAAAVLSVAAPAARADNAVPSWSAKDIDGKVVSSDQLKGKVVVLDFWATWCPPCRMEIPGYIDLQKKYGSDGLVIIGASVDDDDSGRVEMVRKFMQKMGMNYSVVFPEAAMVSTFGDPQGIPATFIIDRNGKVVDHKVGAEPEADFEKRILAVLKPTKA